MITGTATRVALYRLLELLEALNIWDAGLRVWAHHPLPLCKVLRPAYFQRGSQRPHQVPRVEATVEVLRALPPRPVRCQVEARLEQQLLSRQVLPPRNMPKTSGGLLARWQE